MSEFDVNEIAKQLEKAFVGSSGVSFEGKSLKLDTEEDAQEVVDAIETCQNLQYLNLEGNTLGVDAAKAIAKSLAFHSEFKRALWKDMFTGRMKTEIPEALQFLTGSLVIANASLTELDLSDNAFGPIGVERLAVLLRTPVCYSLQILKLNNNGLGISGGTILARGLLECYHKSKEKGQPFSLRVFVAGRNRLENEGAKALAEVFKLIGSLEELVMPQNGIYHSGITALCDALSNNHNLKALNLNDNTVTAKGAKAIARTLPNLQKLRELNLGDCLLKTKGALLLADVLKNGHHQLQEVYLECNEIGPEGGLALAKAMANKQNLKHLGLGGNYFGEEGCHNLQSQLKATGHLHTLASLSDDEGDDDDDDEEDEEIEEVESMNSDTEDEKDHSKDESIANYPCDTNLPLNISSLKVNFFLQAPTAERFLNLGSDRLQRILEEIKSYPSEVFIEKVFPVLMKISSLCGSNMDLASQAAFSCSEILYQEVFRWAKENDKLSIVNNALLVHLGLIKSEDKSLKVTWNLEGCILALEQATRQEYFPRETRDTLQVFLHRTGLLADTFPSAKQKLISSLQD